MLSYADSSSPTSRASNQYIFPTSRYQKNIIFIDGCINSHHRIELFLKKWQINYNHQHQYNNKSHRKSLYNHIHIPVSFLSLTPPLSHSPALRLAGWLARSLFVTYYKTSLATRYASPDPFATRLARIPSRNSTDTTCAATSTTAGGVESEGPVAILPPIDLFSSARISLFSAK